MQSIVARLIAHAKRSPARKLYSFRADGDRPSVELSFGDADRAARAIAVELLKQCTPGDRVVLLFPPGLEYMKCFLGCLYAGLIAVPCYPPEPTRLARTLRRLGGIVDDCDARVVVADRSIAAMKGLAATHAPELLAANWLISEDIALEQSDAWSPPAIEADTIAYLQYTSGSTGQPKGVKISHGNLLHNSKLIHRAFELTDDDSAVIWLPPYHDMGLIGGLIQPIYAGFDVELMSPLAFIQRPMRWLEAMAKTGATVSGAPNFAYDLCVRKSTEEQRAALDLSAWRVAFNGAEPVRHDTMARFLDAFAVSGLRSTVFVPCYGLAEATLIVSGGPPERVTPRSADGLPSSGRVVTDTDLLIVDPATGAVCPDGATGEILVRNQSVGLGYWNQEDASREAFGFSSGDGGPFMRTGDLGFLEDGELYVRGRLKDLIILRGRNYYPNDIEEVVARCHPALRPGCTSAFAVSISGEEQLVIAQEVDERKAPDPDALAAHIREAVHSSFDVQVSQILLVKRGALPKASNGKIQRRAAKKELLAGTLPLWAEPTSGPAFTAPKAPRKADARRLRANQDLPGIQKCLAIMISRAIGRDVAVDARLAELGIDSLQAVGLTDDLGNLFDVELDPAALLHGETLSGVAQAILYAPQATADETSTADRVPPATQALWYEQERRPESAALNISVAFSVDGVDAAQLATSVQRLADIHPALRARFVEQQGQLAIVNDSLPLFQNIDGTTFGDDDLLALVQHDANKPFDLEAGELFRCFLYRGNTQHIVLLSCHHAIADMQSMIRLHLDLESLYLGGEALGKNGGLKAPPTASARASALAHWRATPSEAATALPADVDVTETPKGATYRFALSADVSAAVRRLAKDLGVTPFVVFLTAYKTLLARVTEFGPITVGAPFSKRSPASRDTVGYFINPVPLCSILDESQCFSDAVRVVQKTVTLALGHRNVDFAGLLRDLSPNGAPFRTMLAYESAPGHERLLSMAMGAPGTTCSWADRQARAVALERRDAQFDLTLTLAEGVGGLVGLLDYDTSVITRSTAERLASRFEHLLRGALANHTQTLGEMAIMPPDEVEAVRTLGHVPASDEVQTTIDGWVENTCRRLPLKHAVSDEHQLLRYERLSERANAIAAALEATGIGPGDRVGIYAQRNVDMVAALLGVLRSGAAYVALDPQYPKKRLHYIAEDAALCAVVADPASLADAEAWFSCGPVLSTSQSAGTPSSRQHTARDIAYVIYTSGSTGKPKGVAISHGAATSFLHWAQRSFCEPLSRCIAATTSINFDLSVFEIFGPLVLGGEVALFDSALSFLDNDDDLRRARLALLNTVPSAANELVRANAIPASVQWVLLAGEALPEPLATALYASGIRRVYNLYGPSEDTTYSTYTLVPPGKPPPIGRGLPGTRVYVLDDALRPVPLGAFGEIYLAGPGLAEGYLGRPGLTADRFVPDPFQRGQRMYRTGDLGRWANGMLYYAGRRDQQVKLRGFRIELGEIEHAMRSVPGVHDAVVVVRGDAHPKLCGFFEGSADVGHVQAVLSESLPAQFVPDILCALPSLPRTPNGKLDRKALPEAAPTKPEAAPADAPSSDIIAMFQKVLGCPVGPDDDFFAKGGNSLMAAELYATLQKTCSGTMRFRDFLDAPTPRAVADRLKGSQAAPVPTVTRSDELDGPMTHGQHRLWALEELSPSDRYHMTQEFEISGPVDVDRLQWAIRALVERHDVLRSHFFARDDGTPWQEIAKVPYDLLTVSDARDHADISEDVRAFAATPFQLAKEAPCRFALYRIGDATWRFVAVLHHIAADAWSIPLLLRDLQGLYNKLDTDVPKVRFLDFARWQSDLLDADGADALDERARMLDGVAQELDLPCDQPRRGPLGCAGSVSVSLPHALTAELRDFCRDNGTTLFSALLAGWQAVLARYTEQTHFAVGIPATQRTEAEFHNLVGFCINSHPVVADLRNAPSFSALVAQCTQEIRSVSTNAHVPLQALLARAGLRTDRDFQVMFSLAPKPNMSAQLGQAKLEPLPTKQPAAAKFEISVMLEDDGNDVTGTIEFADALYQRDNIERMLTHFLHLLAEAVAAPTIPVEDLRLAPREALRTAAPLADVPTPLASFLEQARRTPNKIAVEQGAQRLSYQDLLSRAAGVAASLQTQAVRAGDLVAVRLPRSLDLVVAELAVWFLRATFLPIDPYGAPERNERILRTSGARALVTLGEGPTGGLPVVDMDCVPRRHFKETPKLPDGAHAAYTIYTSGSTGQPKGVVITHKSLGHLVAWHHQAFGVDENTRATLLAGPGFDASVWEIWPVLCHGGTLVIPDEETRLDADQLAAWLVDAAVTQSFMPTPLAEQMFQRSWPRGTSLRYLMTGGDRLRLRPSAATPFRVANCYGPTENTVVSTCGIVSPEGQTLPDIGEPLPGHRTYVLDKHLEPCPLGVPGELFVAGPGLARGYLNDAQKTAAAFLPDPFSPAPGARMYRTGDRVKLDADGRLRFLGRRDRQLKISGVRVDLAEVEAAISQHPNVQQAVVEPRPGQRGDELVAYWVAASDEYPTADALRKESRRYLVDTLLPRHWVRLNKLPVTANGKLDRNRLPAPTIAQSKRTAPRCELEQQIALIWQEVMLVTDVGAFDNFFDLGGNSLMAAQIANRLRRELNVAIPAETLFQCQCVAEVAEAVRAANGAEDEDFGTAESILETFNDLFDETEQSELLLALETGLRGDES